jgi:hypothetical protein
MITGWGDSGQFHSTIGYAHYHQPLLGQDASRSNYFFFAICQSYNRTGGLGIRQGCQQPDWPGIAALAGCWWGFGRHRCINRGGSGQGWGAFYVAFFTTDRIAKKIRRWVAGSGFLKLFTAECR